MSARFYSPGLGTFTQLDSVMGRMPSPSAAPSVSNLSGAVLLKASMSFSNVQSWSHGIAVQRVGGSAMLNPYRLDV
jgi:hypothetical protein